MEMAEEDMEVQEETVLTKTFNTLYSNYICTVHVALLSQQSQMNV